MLSVSARATLIGLIAPLCWGMSVGLVRSVTESFGLAPGLSLLYGIGTLVIFLYIRFPHFKRFNKKYLFFGIPLTTIASTLFCISLYLSDGGRQSVEVGMVNYTWPCLIVIFSVCFFGGKARWWIIPGIIISLIGIMMVLGGSNGIDLVGMKNRIASNPWSYGCSFLNAILFALFSNATKKWSNGENPMLIAFFLDFTVFSSLWVAGYGHLDGGTWRGWVSLLIGGTVLATANTAWSYGIMKGNITLLAVASYFTPVFSCLFASLWIGADLDASFYKGILILVAGSLLCWSSTKYVKEKDQSPTTLPKKNI